MRIGGFIGDYKIKITDLLSGKNNQEELFIENPQTYTPHKGFGGNNVKSINEMSAKSLPSGTKRQFKIENIDVQNTGSGLSYNTENSFHDIEFEDSPKQEKSRPQRTYLQNERKSTPYYDQITKKRSLSIV